MTSDGAFGQQPVYGQTHFVKRRIGSQAGLLHHTLFDGIRGPAIGIEADAFLAGVIAHVPQSGDCEQVMRGDCGHRVHWKLPRALLFQPDEPIRKHLMVHEPRGASVLQRCQGPRQR